MSFLGKKQLSSISIKNVLHLRFVLSFSCINIKAQKMQNKTAEAQLELRRAKILVSSEKITFPQKFSQA